MINLRYHIVSITAVFLALGIGLTLGSTFLDRVTVDTLKNQLDAVQARVDETEAANRRLNERVDTFEGREAELLSELPERMLVGHLTDVPVLLVATEGTDAELVDQTVAALAGAGADVVGGWRLTARWRLDDPEELQDLSAVLDVDTDDSERLRRNGAIQMADVLRAGVEPDPAPATDPATPPELLPLDETAQPAPPAEPDLAAALEGTGFIDYLSGPSADSDRVLLPSEGLRIVALSGDDPGSGPQLISLALLDELTADASAPVVAAQGPVEVEDEDGEPAAESVQRTTFVGPLREGELTRDRLSTVDCLDTPSGMAALVLAVEDAGALRLGHYGVAPGASRLLPGTGPDS